MSLLHPQKTGRIFVNLYNFIRDIYVLALSALKNILFLRKSPVRRVFYKQVYFTGIEALKSIIIIGLLIGLVIITQIANLLGLGNDVRTVRILIWIIMRELGPLFAAIIIITRSGNAIATELGVMKMEGEIKSLEVLGINPSAYLIMPRLVGVTAAVIVVTLYFELITILGGLGIASLWWDIALVPYIKSFLSNLTLGEALVSFIKSLFFGIIISTVSCYHGLSVGKTITQIPQAATKAVMQSLFMVFIFDGIITLVVYL